MILADTSIWIDHFRSGDPHLVQILDRGEILIHPFVIGEISLGTLGDRMRRLGSLAKLPVAVLANAAEVSRLIESEHLHGLGIGYVDVHLLASTRLTHDATFWTRDRRLRSVAERLRIAAHMTH